MTDLSRSLNPEFCGLKTSELKIFISDNKLARIFKNDRLSLPEFLRKDNCVILKKIFPSFVHRITRLLGSGVYGTVFGTRGPNNERTAIKISRVESNSKKEINLSRFMHSLGVSPAILNYEISMLPGTRLEYQFISMGRVDGVLLEYFNSKTIVLSDMKEIVDNIFTIIQILDNNNVAHGDMHIGNIGFVKSKGKMEIKLIDFGLSLEKSIPKLDIIQLIRVNHFMIKNIENRDTFDRLVREKADEIYNIKFPVFRTNRKIDVETVNQFESLLREERRRAAGDSSFF